MKMGFMKEVEILEKIDDSNGMLAIQLRNDKITNLRMTSLGNSIAPGYSMVRTTKPLLLRNVNIGEIMKEHGILLERRNFVSAQNNNDEHLYNWLITNKLESDICRMNLVDYEDTKSSMLTNGLTEELKREYYFIDQVWMLLLEMVVYIRWEFMVSIEKEGLMFKYIFVEHLIF